MNLLNIPPSLSREEWLARRRLGIGGSDIAAVIGVDEHRTAVDVWYDKVHGTEETENEYLRAGRMLEPVVAEYYREETGLFPMRQQRRIYTQPAHPFAFGSPDYFLGTDGILECKTTQKDIDDLPVAWFAQVQWYMAMTGRQWADIAWLIRGLNFDHKRVTRDNDFITAALEEGRSFWHDYVLTQTPPEPRTTGDVLKLHPNHADGLLEASDAVYEAYLALLEARSNARAWEDIQREHELAIKLALRDGEGFKRDNNILCTWRTDRKGSRRFLVKE